MHVMMSSVFIVGGYVCLLYKIKLIKLTMKMYCSIATKKRINLGKPIKYLIIDLCNEITYIFFIGWKILAFY